MQIPLLLQVWFGMQFPHVPPQPSGPHSFWLPSGRSQFGVQHCFLKQTWVVAHSDLHPSWAGATSMSPQPMHRVSAMVVEIKKRMIRRMAQIPRTMNVQPIPPRRSLQARCQQAEMKKPQTLARRAWGYFRPQPRLGRRGGRIKERMADDEKEGTYLRNWSNW